MGPVYAKSRGMRRRAGTLEYRHAKRFQTIFQIVVSLYACVGGSTGRRGSI